MRMKKLASPVITSYRRMYQVLCDGSLLSRVIHGTPRADQRAVSSHRLSSRSGGDVQSSSVSQETGRPTVQRPNNDSGDDGIVIASSLKVCQNTSGGNPVGWTNLRHYSAATDGGGPVLVDSSSTAEENAYFGDLADDVLHHLETFREGASDYGLTADWQGTKRMYTSDGKTIQLRRFGVTKEKLELRRELIRRLAHNILNLEDVKLVGQVLSEWVKEFPSRRYNAVSRGTVKTNSSSSTRGLTCRFIPYSEVARVVHAVLQIVGEQGYLECALEVVRWMERQGWCKLDPHLYTTIIDTLGEAGCLELAEKIFNSLDDSSVEKDVALFNAMINARGKAGQIDSLEDLFESMKKGLQRPDLVTYNTVMNSYVKGGMGLGTVVSVFKDMYTQGIEPDIISFNILLEACVAGGHVREAQKVFENLKKRALKPTVVTYTTLINVYASAGHRGDALLLLSEMLAHNCLPNAVTFSSLITACARDGVYDEAEKLFQVMKEFNVEPNIITYNAMIDLYKKSGDFASARRLYEEMKLAGLEPTSVTLASLMSAYKTAGVYDEVFAIYDEAKVRAMCNEHVFTEAIDTCIKSGNIKRVSDVQTDMLAVNCPPDVVTCSVVLSALGTKCSSEKDACTLVNFLQAFDFHLIKGSCRMLLEIMTSDEEVQGNIQKLYLLLDKEDIRTWTVFTCALVDALWALGWYRRATLLVAWVMERGLFEDICIIQPREWKLDLRRLSKGAALVALYQWLGHLLVVARHLETLHGREIREDGTVQRGLEVENRGDGEISVEEGGLVDLENTMQVEILIPLLPRLEDMLPGKKSRASGKSELSLLRPPLISVVTGWGKLSKEEGTSIVRNAVQKEMIKLSAPFRRSTDSGKWMARGESLMRWLISPRTAPGLVLSDIVADTDRAQ
ncbi:hypothetical protein R1flu_025167 [Riccia fluitans]|uniref:Pentatricopeptide repeat-containing protein n=1 Tax=Riccia fluitans TaxID=41844 RepID=A0ABD1XWZ4_9MARC